MSESHVGRTRRHFCFRSSKRLARWPSESLVAEPGGVKQTLLAAARQRRGGRESRAVKKLEVESGVSLLNRTTQQQPCGPTTGEASVIFVAYSLCYFAGDGEAGIKKLLYGTRNVCGHAPRVDWLTRIVLLPQLRWYCTF